METTNMPSDVVELLDRWDAEQLHDEMDADYDRAARDEELEACVAEHQVFLESHEIVRGTVA